MPASERWGPAGRWSVLGRRGESRPRLAIPGPPPPRGGLFAPATAPDGKSTTRPIKWRGLRGRAGEPRRPASLSKKGGPAFFHPAKERGEHKKALPPPACGPPTPQWAPVCLPVRPAQAVIRRLANGKRRVGQPGAGRAPEPGPPPARAQSRTTREGPPLLPASFPSLPLFLSPFPRAPAPSTCTGPCPPRARKPAR